MAYPTIAQLNFVAIDNIVGQQPIMQTSATQKHSYGQTIRGLDQGSLAYGEGLFIYLQGVASTAAGSVVAYNTVTGVTVLSVAASRGPVAVAMAATSSTSLWGWYQVVGNTVVNAASATINLGINVTATAGQVASGTAALTLIYGATALAAFNTPTAGFVQVGIGYPAVLGFTPSAVG